MSGYARGSGPLVSALGPVPGQKGYKRGSRLEAVAQAAGERSLAGLTDLPPTMRASPVTLRSRAQGALTGALAHVVPERDAMRLADKFIGAGQIAAPVDPIGAEESWTDARNAWAQGRPFAAGGNLGLMALAVAPGGSKAKGFIKGAAKGVEKKLAKGLLEGAPAIVRPEAEQYATGVLETIAGKRGKRTGFKKWRDTSDPGKGTLFDYSNLDKRPDVPQVQIPRFQAPKGPSARIVDALANPDVEQGLNAAVKRGMAMPGGLDWYNTEPFRQEFIRLLGPDEGARAYSQFFDAVPATSIGMKVPDNIRLASYYNWKRQTGQDVLGKIDPGYGAKTQKNHQRLMDNLIRTGQWDIFKNPKPASFSQDLQGNWLPITGDTHNFRLPGILSRDPRFLATSTQELYKGGKDAAVANLLSNYPDLSPLSIDEAIKNYGKKNTGPVIYRPQDWLKSGEISMDQAVKDPALWASMPRKNEYGPYEAWQQEQAKKLGIDPAPYQSSMWVGGGDITGLGSPPEPFLQTLEARANYTAAQLGIDPKAVLDHLIRGKGPLLSVGAPLAGAGALGAYVASQPPGQEQERRPIY